MPNFDGGHYYLTALIPIATDRLVEVEGMTRSPIQLVRDVLATLPTALQTKATEHIGINSPFSRNTRTHFSRFVVIDSLMYNGRNPQNAIKIAAASINPVLPQPQDKLSCPFLLFVADFDAESGNTTELTSYLTELWKTMEAELRAVFTYCAAFEKRVSSGESFAKYIQDCQLETTMPFNDYWTTAPPLKSLLTFLIVFFFACGVGGFVLAWSLGGGLGARIGCLVAGIVIGLIFDYWIVMTRASRPLPAAPSSDLPSVLKALYLQQKFTQLAIDVQGRSDQDLHDRFRDFLKIHQPFERQPTQEPGVIHS